MANETTLTIIGNLTRDPEVKWIESGAAVASFNIASTPRYYAAEAGQWRDGEPLFLRCSAWRGLAEHVAESLSKGARVIASGRLKQRSFETNDGENRVVFELEVDDIGPSLKWATANVTRTGRTGTPARSSGGFGGAAGADQPPF